MYLSFVCEWVNRWTSVRGMPGNLIQWMNLRFSIYSLDILCGVAFFIEISYYASSHQRFILHGVKSMFHTGHTLAPKCCHLFQCILKWCRQFATAIVVSNSKYTFFIVLLVRFIHISQTLRSIEVSHMNFHSVAYSIQIRLRTHTRLYAILKQIISSSVALLLN